jgi:hypothetical protein
MSVTLNSQSMSRAKNKTANETLVSKVKKKVGGIAHTFQSDMQKDVLEGPASVEARQVLDVAQQKEEGALHRISAEAGEQKCPIRRVLPTT